MVPRKVESNDIDIRSVLEGTLEYLNTGWCQDVGARDKHGREVPWHYERARSWTVINAVRRSIQDLAPGDVLWEDERGPARRKTLATVIDMIGCEAGIALEKPRSYTPDDLIEWNELPDQSAPRVKLAVYRALAASA